MTKQEIKEKEAIAAGKVYLLQKLATAVLSGEKMSSGYLAKQCGLSVEEWHGSGQLLASLFYFAVEKDFLDWHAKTML